MQHNFFALFAAGIVIEEKNWPPLFPIIHHDIANEIPIHLQRLQYFAFASLLGILSYYVPWISWGLRNCVSWRSYLKIWILKMLACVVICPLLFDAVGFPELGGRIFFYSYGLSLNFKYSCQRSWNKMYSVSLLADLWNFLVVQTFVGINFCFIFVNCGLSAGLIACLFWNIIAVTAAWIGGRGTGPISAVCTYLHELCGNFLP